VTIGVILFLSLALDTITNINLLQEQKIILYGVASSLMIFGLVKAEDKGRVVGDYYWIQILGKSSYSLYLIHFPLISILCKLSLLIYLNKLGLIGAAISYISIFALCLISSVVFYLWIEKPTGAYLQSRFIKPTVVVKENITSRR